MRQSITKQLTAIKWWDGIIGKLDKNREREEEQKRKKDEQQQQQEGWR